MTTDDFARRHGYREEHPVFKSPDFLPDKVRVDGGEMIVNRLDDLSDGMRFIDIVQDVLPPSDKLWEWRANVPAPLVVYEAYPAYRVEIPTDKRSYRNAREHLVQPLRNCDWRLFYTVVEEVCAAWRRAGTDKEVSFASEFNLLLRSYGIPWALQGGWVIPVADSEFTEDLEYVRQVDQVPNADIATNPLVSLKNAFDALYRKQGGSDITGACNHAWGAWETTREAAGGINKVKSTYPELWEAITAWQRLIHAGRHPGKKLGRLPTESETRFIVGLCVNAVRLLSSSHDSGDAT